MSKRFLTAFLFVFSALLLFAQDTTWFRDVSTPVAASELELTALTASLRNALLARTPREKLVKDLPRIVDKTPRILFITLGDGVFPSRTYYSVGGSFSSALESLLAIVEKRESEYTDAIRADLDAQIARAKEEKRLLPDYVKKKFENPSAWSSLRLDIVQATLPVDSFVVNSSRLLLSSAVGIAFDRTAAFAFTPEQLTGRYLMTAERQLSVSRIGNLISEANLWTSLGLWLKMGAAETPFKVTLFETDSYYADEAGCRRLFRAHPARFMAQPSETHAIGLLRRTCTTLHPKKGTLRPPFPEWVVGRRTGKTALFDQAALAYGLVQAAKASPDAKTREELLGLAKLATKPLLDATKHLDPKEELENGQLISEGRRKSSERLYAMVVEGEDNPNAIEFEVPTRVGELRTNALAYLLYSELDEILPDNDKIAKGCRAELAQLYRHLFSQVNAEGVCIPVCVYPSRTMKFSLVGDEPLSLADSLECAALAGLALDAHRRAFPDDDTEQLRARLNALKEAVATRTVDNLADAPFSPYLARFLATDATAENPERLAQLTRLAIAAAANVETQPALPDMYGCDANIPSMTYAAERMGVIAIAADALARTGKREDSLALLQEAWPLWCFQRQAEMTPEPASTLAQPFEYIGFQRDNLADYGFTLNGQTTQAAAELALAGALKTLGMERFEPTERQLSDWENAWTTIDKHPICLAQELVLKGIPSEENRRALSGNLGKASVETFKVEDANLKIEFGGGGTNHVETKVIDRRKR